jgi:hypothetical protein
MKIVRKKLRVLEDKYGVKVAIAHAGMVVVLR